MLTFELRHNESDGASNHRRLDCLLSHSFRRRSKKVSRHWPLQGEFTVDRWIPPTKGHKSGKCFHLMMSSWNYVMSQSPADSPTATKFHEISRLLHSPSMVAVGLFFLSLQGDVGDLFDPSLLATLRGRSYSEPKVQPAYVRSPRLANDMKKIGPPKQAFVREKKDRLRKFSYIETCGGGQWANFCRSIYLPIFSSLSKHFYLSCQIWKWFEE